MNIVHQVFKNMTIQFTVHQHKTTDQQLWKKRLKEVDHVYLRHPWSSVSQYSWSTFHWYLDQNLIDLFINNGSTLDWHLAWSINMSLSLCLPSTGCLWVTQVSIEYLLRRQLSINLVSTKYQSRCWLSIDWDVKKK